MIEKVRFTTTKTARYFTMGTLSEHTEHIWVVCHGYGQLAEFFIKKFQAIEDDKTYIIAPEALNKFYLNGHIGRVGANWMTKVDREDDIADYVHFINEIYNSISNQLHHKPKLTVLGFSQGVATACRWVAEKEIACSRLILWAGLFPDELKNELPASLEKLKESHIYMVYGDNDPLMEEKHIQEIEHIKYQFPAIEVLTFTGGHELNDSLLKELKSI